MDENDLFNRFVITLVALVLLAVVIIDIFAERLPFVLRVVVLAAAVVCLYLAREKRGGEDS